MITRIADPAAAAADVIANFVPADFIFISKFIHVYIWSSLATTTSRYSAPPLPARFFPLSCRVASYRGLHDGNGDVYDCMLHVIL